MSRDNRTFFVAGLVAAIVVAVLIAQFASSSPDGLEYVADQEGFAETAAEHDLAETPLADYGENLTSNSWVNNAVAGLAGVLLTLGIGYGIFWMARRSNRDRPASA
jgi:high-affinity Fe2+/Pb2+ permease